MRPLFPIPGSGVVIASAATALPFPPVVQADVLTAGWNGDVVTANRGAFPEFDLEIYCASATSVNMTVAHLYAGSQHAFVYADDTFTAANASEIFTNATHGLQTGDGPFQVSNSGGALPAGLSALTDYWVIIIDANTFYLATSLANALAGTHLSITTDGTGTQTIADTSATKRIHWLDIGLLGIAGDGAIALTLNKGYVERIKHRPNTIALAVSATLSAGSVTCVVYPVQDLR